MELDTLPSGEAVTGFISILCNRGDDTVIKWGSSETSRNAARAEFDALKGRGFSMWELDRNDEKTNRRVERFDPELRGIIAIPQMVGG